MNALGFSNIGEIIIPQKVRSHLHNYIKKTGVDEVPYAFYGKMFYLIILLALFVEYKYVLPIISYSVLVLFVGGFLSIFILIFIYYLAFAFILKNYYETKIYKRTEKIEEILPRYLEAIKTNLKAGMAFDEALLESLEPDYDILKYEIQIVAEKSITGENTEEALNEFADKYNSEMLKEAVDLMIISISGGAKMTDILEKLIDSINTNNYLKKSVISSVMGYVLFISIIAIFISPILFALSYNLLVIFEGFGAKLGSTASEFLSLEFKVLVQKDDFINFSMIAISLISFFSSLIIVTLKKGNIKGGWKTIPIYIGISLVVYKIAFFLVTWMFSGFF